MRQGASLPGVLVLAVGLALASGAWSVTAAYPVASPATSPGASPGASPGTTPGASPDGASLLAELAQLRSDNAALTRQVSDLTAQRDRLQGAVAGFADLYDPLEADRLLTLELRKDLPAVRADAEAYLTHVQTLAQRSDPARLSPVMSRVLETAPVYLDWRDQTFATSDEANAAYLQSGASGFDTNWRAFRDAALLTVSGHLDAVLSLLDRMAR